MLIEYVRRPVYGQVSKKIMDEVMHVLTGQFTDVKTDAPEPEVSPWRLGEVRKTLKSTINNQKVGMMLAYALDGKVQVGYSQWNAWEDPYDKGMMFDVCLERLERFEDRLEANPDFTPKVPFEIAKRLPGFVGRCKRYFKDATLPRWAEKYATEDPGAPMTEAEVVATASALGLMDKD